MVVENLERDLEVARHELPRPDVAPCGIADRAPLRPHAEVADGVSVVVPALSAV